MSTYTATYTFVTLVPATSHVHYEPNGTYTVDGETYQRNEQVYYALAAQKGEKRDGFLVLEHRGDRVVGYIERGNDGWSFQKVRAAYGHVAGQNQIFAQADREAAIAAGKNRIVRGLPPIKSMDEVHYLNGSSYVFDCKTKSSCLMRAGYMARPKQTEGEK